MNFSMTLQSVAATMNLILPYKFEEEEVWRSLRKSKEVRGMYHRELTYWSTSAGNTLK